MVWKTSFTLLTSLFSLDAIRVVSIHGWLGWGKTAKDWGQLAVASLFVDVQSHLSQVLQTVNSG